MKRVIDLIIVFISFIFLFPVFIFICFVQKFFVNIEIFFFQKRPGLNEKPFNLYKFKTMRDEIGSDGNLIEDNKRITKFGRWLRTLSFDELPSLFNVLMGEMSLVGPRPLLMEYLPLYSKKEAQRHNVKPGITGWAQINGRNSITWNEKFQLDLWYIKNQSFLLDLKILFLTIWKVFRKEGISYSEVETMPKFKRSKNK